MKFKRKEILKILMTAEKKLPYHFLITGGLLGGFGVGIRECGLESISDGETPRYAYDPVHKQNEVGYIICTEKKLFRRRKQWYEITASFSDTQGTFSVGVTISPVEKRHINTPKHELQERCLELLLERCIVPQAKKAIEEGREVFYWKKKGKEWISFSDLNYELPKLIEG